MAEPDLIAYGLPGSVECCYFTWQAVHTALLAFEIRRNVSPAVRPVPVGPAWPSDTCGSWQLPHSTSGPSATLSGRT